MSAFEIKMSKDGEATVLTLSGFLNEDFVQSGFEVPNANLVKIDLKNLKGINSCGLRDFINFLRRFSAETIVQFHHCPPFFVQQANMVGGLLNKMHSIYSLYACYVESSTEEELIEYFETANLKWETIPKTLSKDGKNYEFDGAPETFFRFLRMKY